MAAWQVEGVLSGVGQEATSPRVRPMSAVAPKADIRIGPYWLLLSNCGSLAVSTAMPRLSEGGLQRSKGGAPNSMCDSARS